MKLNKFISLVMALAVSILMLANIAFAQGDRAGGAGATQLLVPVGAVGSALNGTNMAYSSGADAIHWNPAGIAVNNSSTELLVSRYNYIADIDVNYAAATFKAGAFGALGISLKTFGFGNIPVTTEANPDGSGEFFSPQYLTVGLTYARQMTDRINIGFTTKIVSEKVLSTRASGAAFDVGIQYNTQRGVVFGVVLKNFGPNMKYSGSDGEVFTNDGGNRPDAAGRNYQVPLASFELPTTLELGLTYIANINESNALYASGAFANNNFGLNEWKLALEYNFNELVFLRGAYTMGYDPAEEKLRSQDEVYVFGPALGGGVQFGLGDALDFSFDYAYRFNKLFDNTQWFSLSFGF